MKLLFHWAPRGPTAFVGLLTFPFQFLKRKSLETTQKWPFTLPYVGIVFSFIGSNNVVSPPTVDHVPHLRQPAETEPAPWQPPWFLMLSVSFGRRRGPRPRSCVSWHSRTHHTQTQRHRHPHSHAQSIPGSVCRPRPHTPTPIPRPMSFLSSFSFHPSLSLCFSF